LQWYVVKVQSGREGTVQEAIQRRARAEGLEDAVGRILIPVEKVLELRSGRRIERTRKLFPGYLMCELKLDDRVLTLFHEIPGVGDFVGSGAAPVPLSPAEVERLVGAQAEDRVTLFPPAFNLSGRLRILRGAFAQMEGEVVEVLANTGQVRVRLEILGRPVTLDLEASEVLQLAGAE